jgi:hypothetical protein
MNPNPNNDQGFAVPPSRPGAPPMSDMGGGMDRDKLMQLLKLLPLILAGVKGGMPAVGGYASGLAQGEQRNQMLGMRQDEMAYGREQDQMQRQRQEAMDARQRQQDHLAEAERMRRNQREAVTASTDAASAAMESAPIEDEVVSDLPFEAVVPPELGVYAAASQAAKDAGYPEAVNRVAPMIRPALSKRNRTNAQNFMERLKGADLEAVRTSGQKFRPEWANREMTLDEIAEMAGVPMGLPQKPKAKQIREGAGGFYGIDPESLEATKVEGVQPKPPASQIGIAGGLSPDALDMVALLYTKTGQLPPLGMGAAAAGLRQQILTRAAELGNSPDIASSMSGFKADQASLTMLTKRYDATKAFADQAAQTLNVAEQVSGAVDRGQLPSVNRLSNWLRGQVGDKDLSRLEYAIYTAARDVAKVTTGGSESVAALTDASASNVDRLLNAAQSPEQFKAVLAQMRVDIKNYMAGLRDQRDEVMRRVRKDDAPEAARGGRQALKDRLRGGR